MSDIYNLGQFALAKGGWMRGPDGLNLLGAQGGTAPSDATSGYFPGCLFLRTGSGGGAYVNLGTTASCNFDQLVTDGGTVTALTVTTANLSAVAFAAAGTVALPANTAAALGVSDGTTTMLTADTRNTIADVNSFLFQSAATTIATAAAAHLNPTVRVAAKTITYTGTNTVTSSLGVQMYLGIPTFTDASAGTLSLASTLHVSAVAAAGGSLTLTAARMISTGVADCYLTNAGVWTDTACWERGKDALDRGKDAAKHVLSTLDKLVPATWRYKGDHGDDHGRERVGIVYDDLPEELRAPGADLGTAGAVSPGLLASFALAALKLLRDENQELRSRLDALETA